MALSAMIPILVTILSLLAGTAWAQITPTTGPPEDAFAGGPIRITRVSAALLANAYPNNAVPILPMPFRARLDTALVSGNAGALASAKRDLADTYGRGAVLVWERTRFLGTGGIAIATEHARTLASAGLSNTDEMVATLWLYALAATMIDAARCADPMARDAAVDRLRGPANDAVLRVLRTMPEPPLARAQDVAIKLEAPLAEQRTSDALCRTGGQVSIRPIEQWQPATANVRAMLPRHLKAMLSVLRPKNSRPN